MKMIEIKKDGKTIYKIVPDDYKEDGCDDKPYGDLTTGSKKLMSYSDVSSTRWEKIFGKNKKLDEPE